MSYSSEVLSDSPLGYWRLGEASGTTASDSSGNSHDGTYGGSPTLGAASLLLGDSDTSMETSGSGAAQGMVVTSAAWMQVGTISVECIIRPDSVSGNRHVVSRRVEASSTTSDAWLIRQSDANLQWIIVIGTTATTISALSALTAGGTFHVVGTFDGTTSRLYINGVEVGSASVSGAINNGSRDLTLSRNPGTSNFRFDGKTDEVAIYSGALSSTRITAHYNAGFSVGGALTGTLPALTGDLAGTMHVVGDVDATLPPLTGDVTGTYGPDGDLTGALPALTGDLAGTFTPSGISGGLTGTLPALTGDVAGSNTDTGTLAGSLPALTGDIEGTTTQPDIAGDLTGALPALVGGLTGAVTSDAVGTLTGALPALVGSFDATHLVLGSDTENRGNGRRRTGYFTWIVANPVTDPPSDIHDIPVTAVSVPAPTMVDGRPQ